jgi:Zn-dependent protease
MPDITPDRLVEIFILYMVFLFSTTCHEAAHALVAKLGGDETASVGGQVTLNPMPHIQREPWGMVVFPILSLLLTGFLFGWASAPYDPAWQYRHPRRAAWMALAGPAANYTLMLLAAVGLRVGWSQGWLPTFPTSGGAAFALQVFFAFFSLNLLLGTFNLIPFPPLDGSSAIMLFMSEKSAQRYLNMLSNSGSYRLIGLLVAFYLFRYLYGPIDNFATQLFLRSHF